MRNITNIYNLLQILKHIQCSLKGGKCIDNAPLRLTEHLPNAVVELYFKPHIRVRSREVC